MCNPHYPNDTAFNTSGRRCEELNDQEVLFSFIFFLFHIADGGHTQQPGEIPTDSHEKRKLM